MSETPGAAAGQGAGHCDDCDWSFNCFTDGSQCRKQPQAAGGEDVGLLAALRVEYTNWLKSSRDNSSDRTFIRAIEITAPFEAELLRLRARVPELEQALEAAQSVLWMAREYAEAGGSNGPEMRDFEEVSRIIALAKEPAKA